MKGRQASPDEVRARWAYSELTSARFAQTYTAPKHLFDQATAGVDYDNLSGADKIALQSLTSTERTGLWQLL